MKRIVFVFLAIFFLAAAVTSAGATGLADDNYSDLIGALPDSVGDLLPDGFGSDPEKDVESISSWDFLLSAIGSGLSDGFKKILPSFSALVGLVILSAAASAIGSSLSPRGSAILGLAVSVTVGIAAVGQSFSALAAVSSYFSDLTLLVNIMSPLVLTLYASGGNVASGSVTVNAMAMFMSFFENLVAKTALPICGFTLGLNTAAYALPGECGLDAVAAFFKKTYVTVITFMSTVFCAVLAAQSTLATAKDSISLRAAKFVAGSAIPIVGGTVGESLKTLSAGVVMLRKCVGVTGIILVALITLPVILLLLTSRLAVSAAGAVAGLFGQSGVRKLLDGIAGIYGVMLAAAIICSLMFSFLLILLANAVPAI